MKSFEKIITQKYTPKWVHLNFYTYSKKFKNIRYNMEYKCNSCIKCDRKFKLDEMIALASFINVGNKVMCNKCAEEIM